MRIEKEGFVLHLEGTWCEISNKYAVLEACILQEALVYGGRQYSLHIGQQIQTDYRDQLPDSDSRQIRREVGDMVIVGYYAHGNKHYVAFKDEADTKGRFMITDGFHDRPVTERNQGKYEGYVKIDKAECNIKKIIGRIRGTRPWHPLLRLLQKEAG